MIVTEHTDLTLFAGKRVVVNRYERRALIQTIWHDRECRNVSLHGGFGGVCIEEPHGDCRGGGTGYWWPYGTRMEIVE